MPQNKIEEKKQQNEALIALKKLLADPVTLKPYEDQIRNLVLTDSEKEEAIQLYQESIRKMELECQSCGGKENPENFIYSQKFGQLMCPECLFDLSRN